MNFRYELYVGGKFDLEGDTSDRVLIDMILFNNTKPLGHCIGPRHNVAPSSILQTAINYLIILFFGFLATRHDTRYIETT